MQSGSSGKAVFLTGSLMRHVTRMSLTTSIGLMAIFAVDFVDMVFISMLGNDALAAAVGYAGTLLFFTNSVNVGLSIAAGALVARELGAGRPERARQFATSVAILGILFGLIVSAIVMINIRFLLSALGAEGEVLRLAARYVSIILPTMWVMAMAMAGMAVLRANGDARRSMMATIYGGITNAVLDPILIFAVGLGLDGAAIASVIARICMLIAAIRPAVRVHRAFARPSFQQVLGDFRSVRAIAVPAVLTNVATPVGNAIVIREIAQFGTDAVAGMAVIGRLIPVAFSVIFALSGAIGPIVGQNFGAGQHDRVKEAFWSGVKFTAVYVCLMAATLYILREPIADLFRAQGETRALIYLFCGPLALASFFNGVIFVSNASFNNLGHPVYSTWVNWGRHTLGTWPFAVAGAYIAGAPGVLIGQALGGVIFAAICIVLVRRVVSRLKEPQPVDPFSGQKRLQALFGRRGW
ncbi:Multidrug export protein MepA [Ruegeria sp. THAF57]|uniref:MATE family efflux transporter n=1 Tax=Ruegeria sp. THAF57 TaxID=2744555 RepID=UPI001754FADA|nr:MATE family efflux transporter [Ruegeria sp. THAF57]CAD0183449.1 Multidrug export protein MepA [Ruegeria sp. THAF57]